MVRSTLEDLEDWAIRKGGRCLSEVFTINSDVYRWECEEEHQWNAKWENVKRGNWCSKCVYNQRKNSVNDCQCSVFSI